MSHRVSASNSASRGRRALFSLLVLITALAGDPCRAWPQTPSGYELLGRGVNYGNMLESPREGAWGTRFQDAYPELIKAAGFDSVRIPVRWSAHTAQSAPFQIDPEFLSRVKSIVELNLAQGLKVVLNVHHFDELYADPGGQRDRFLAMWRQLAEQFQNADERLVFELLNEPHDKLTADLWNALLADCLREIRPTHPTRWIVVGPDQWNSVKRLPLLRLPAADRKLIVTVHYYLPFPFTHQGASWVRPSPPVGKTWTGTPGEKAAIERDLAPVIAWAKEHNRPLYVGEFGAYNKADMDSRARWTRQVRQTCEQAGCGWGYWELCAGFGVLDPSTNQWRQPLLEALTKR